MTTKKHVIVIPYLMRPQPWKHLWAWLTRTYVPTTEYTSRAAAADNWDQYIREREAHETTRRRIEDLARDHQPRPWGNQFGATTFSCIKCAQQWPCATYQWATDTNYEPLKLVERKPAAHNSEDGTADD